MTELGYKTLRESIVDIIRKRIINRELQPGQKIVEQELAKEFQTSRAPIREALRELENDYGSASSGRKDTGRNAAGDGRNPGTHEESGCGRI